MIDQPLLNGRFEEHPDAERDRARQPGARILQVGGAEPEAGQEHRPPQRLALPRTAMERGSSTISVMIALPGWWYSANWSPPMANSVRSAAV